MIEERYHTNDHISTPLAGAVLLKKTGSWTILFSVEEQSLYIVPTDYHPEPLRIHKSELHQLKRTMRALTDRKRKARRGSLSGESASEG